MKQLMIDVLITVVGGFFNALMWIGEKLEEMEVDDD